jgi:FtsP/CotA-like multicopper oxidase with cupredoxin domain
MIARQRNVMDRRDPMERGPMEGFAASSARIFGVHRLRLAIMAGAAAALVGLYVGTKHFFSIEGVAAEQSRTYRLDIGESCLNGTAEAPLLEAREGDRVMLTITSLYAGELYLHGLERETGLAPGSETTITFTAAHAGRYYLHLHGADENHPHAEVAVLEVAPR